MGVIAPPGDIRAFADGVIEVIENRSIYCRERSHISQHYSLEGTLNEYERLLLHLMEVKNKR
jgi:glycosyltransferase involved in cell wall biosynthesis